MADNNSSSRNSVIPFEFDGADVRVLWRDDAPWFVAKDVALVLGYAKPRNAISAHCKGALKQGLPTKSGNQDVTIIPERDLYRLIMRSKLPAAERFEEWVVGEVLPSIRETGSYSTTPALPDFTDPAIAARAWAAEYEQREALEREMITLLPKAQYHDRVKKAVGSHTIDEGAKILRTGRNRLFKWLRTEGFLMKGNIPYQEYLNQGLFRVVQKTHYRGDTPYIYSQTLITGKGMIVIQNRLDNSLLGRML